MSAVTRPLLMRVLGLACRAPSVHNTQPWRWRIATPTTLELYADPTRRLRVADPEGRNLAMSCGASLHHAVTAAQCLGLTTHVDLADTTSPLLASVRLGPGSDPVDAQHRLDGLEERYTDRRRFTAWPVPDKRLLELSEAASGWGAYAVPLIEDVTRSRVELLMSRARTAQALDDRHVEEQRAWIDRGSGDGIPAIDAAPPTTGRALTHPTRFQPDPAPTSQEGVESTEGLVAICTDDDDRTAWLQAGETLSALWLHAQHAGLSVVPLSQVLEVPETCRALRDDVFRGRPRPQLLVRMGWQQITRPALPRTTRRPLAEVVTG